jgi:hypothetical protein
MLIDVSERDLSTQILGRRISLPIGVAPTAMQRMAHPDGECASARAAQVSQKTFFFQVLPKWNLVNIDYRGHRQKGNVEIYNETEIILDIKNSCFYE